MAYVKVDETEPLEKAIKRFKRMVEKARQISSGVEQLTRNEQVMGSIPISG